MSLSVRQAGPLEVALTDAFCVVGNFGLCCIARGTGIILCLYGLYAGTGGYGGNVIGNGDIGYSSASAKVLLERTLNGGTG